MIGFVAALLLLLLIPGGVALLWLTGRTASIANFRNRSSRALETNSFFEFLVRLTFAALGPAAILALSVAYAELVPLDVLLAFWVVPAYVAMLVLGILFPKLGRLALIGFTAGVVSTLLYDVTRLVIGYSNGAVDPIPHIGEVLIGPGTDWWVGYLWRTFGNGPGLAMPFVMLFPRRFLNPWGGLAWGTMVGTGMLAVLFFFPAAQLHLFVLSAPVVVNGFLGHWTYGLTLGLLVMLALRRQPKSRGKHAKVRVT